MSKEFDAFGLIGKIDKCWDGTCVGLEAPTKVTLKIPAIKFEISVAVRPKLTLNKGAWVKPQEGKFTVPIEINGHRYAKLGVRVKTTYFSGKAGDFIVSPVLELESPAFGLKLANGDLFKYGPEVSAFVDSVLQRSGYKRLSLVGHDMGGLLARWYVNHTPVPRRVEKVVFIGTPHRGAETVFLGYKVAKFAIAYLSKMTGPVAPLVKSLAGALLDMVLGEGGKHLFPHSTFVQALNGHPESVSTWDGPDPGDFLTDEVQVYNHVGQDYVGGVELLSPSFSHWHLPLPFKDPLYDMPNVDNFVIPWFARGDFFVALDAARLTNTGVTEHVIDGWEAFHWALNGDHGRNVDLIVEDLLAPHSIPADSGSTLRASARFSGVAAPLPSDVPAAGPAAGHSIVRDAVLAPGESFTVEVPVDGALTEGLVVAQSPGAISLVVDGPRGNRRSEEISGVTTRWVELGSPGPGTYFATVTLAPDATEPTPVLVSAFFRTQAYLALRTAGATRTQSGADRIPGEDVLINAVFATATGLLDASSVTCSVRAPDGSTHAVELFDDGAHRDGEPGDGVHTGVLPGASTVQPGTYEARCRGLGTTGGEVVERFADLPFRVRWAAELGIVPGSLRVSPNLRAGVATEIHATVFNQSARESDVVAVQAGERKGPEDRVVGCSLVGQIGSGDLKAIRIPWTPQGEGCRDLTVALAGPAAGSQISDAPEQAPAGAYERATLRVCASAARTKLVADVGGPYRYQAGGRRVTFDGTGSENTTPATRFEWSVASNGTVVATGTGPVSVVELPKLSNAVVTLRLTDPVLGSASASAPVTFVGALDHDEWFQDTTPPVAVIEAPAVAYVGEPVTIRSASYDDMGAPPVQAFNFGGLSGNAVDAVGRVVRPVFAAPGEYDIVLTVQDNAGFWSTATRTLRVERRQPAISSVVLPDAFEVGKEAIAYVQLQDGGAANDVQVTLGSSTPDGFTIRASGSAQTDACGIAQVRVTPSSLEPIDVRVEVLGYTTCDAATGACTPGLAKENPTGKPPLVRDTTGPSIAILSPAAEDAVFDSCRPMDLRFAVSDEGAGVDPATIAVVLDGLRVGDAGSCVEGLCALGIDTATLAPGVHQLTLSAADALGNRGTVERDFRIDVTVPSIACRVGSAVCADIAPDGTVNALLAHLDAAHARELDHNLKAAANNLAAFIAFASAQDGKHVPAACADLLVSDAAWVARVRWGMNPTQL